MNTRYPAMIAAIAGAEVRLPPARLLSAGRRPADTAGLTAWLETEGARFDALIVSCEQLAFGGLLASRISAEPIATALARLEALRVLRSARPRLPILGFSLIARVSNANDATEEPPYWAEFGERFYALSQLLDRRELGHPVATELAAAAATIPAEHRRDLLARRLRNHLANAAALGLLADGTLDLLVLSSDDTSPFGLPSREKRILSGWAGLLGLTGGEGTEPSRGAPLLMYPGADEVGCALVARLLNGRAGSAPRIAVAYAPAAAAAHVAPYEDGPVHLTVERQALAAGAALVDGTELPADLWMGVAAPVARRGEYDPDLAASERAGREEPLAGLVAEASRRMAAGQPVAIADVAYPNGADPALAEPLAAALDLPALAAYGAWNTAGNTIGTVIAQASAARLISTAAGREAQTRFLAHRFVEDWGYQRVVRAEARAWLRARTGHPDPRSPGEVATTARWIAARLEAFLAGLPGFGDHYRIAPGSVVLPWGRTFEIDFELMPMG